MSEHKFKIKERQNLNEILILPNSKTHIGKAENTTRSWVTSPIQVNHIHITVHKLWKPKRMKDKLIRAFLRTRIDSYQNVRSQ